ncbi:hypothetical protein Hs30E_03190 [Lactococcus hodotermopsidis]|uniref:TPM domain-containing protein n=1 Tax=Pseudolactococcus hodotermopsidis TaxID=2709157 RepID=A0A6A0BBH3_9LACT|nr:TPM domain-containing protein [Lactococcus hodotermopsidis]GFH41768.1 hypothetical protein Hs30E_03190 [Lactococcus hodotermopsidis]
MKNKFTQKIIVITVVLVAVAGVFGFFKWRNDENGADDIEKIVWQNGTYVYDDAAMLTDTTENVVNSELNRLDVTDVAQVIVLTVPTLKDHTIEDYANTVFEKTGIGGNSDKGLLVLIAKQEKRVWIEVGDGLEGELNDGKVGRILDDDFVPYRDKNDYDTAISKTITAISGVLTGQLQVSGAQTSTQNSGVNKPEEGNDSFAGLILLVVIIIGVILAVATGHGDIILWLIMTLLNNRGGGRGSGGSSSRKSGRGFGSGSSSGGGAGR